MLHPLCAESLAPPVSYLMASKRQHESLKKTWKMEEEKTEPTWPIMLMASKWLAAARYTRVRIQLGLVMMQIGGFVPQHVPSEPDRRFSPGDFSVTTKGGIILQTDWIWAAFLVLIIQSEIRQSENSADRRFCTLADRYRLDFVKDWNMYQWERLHVH